MSKKGWYVVIAILGVAVVLILYQWLTWLAVSTKDNDVLPESVTITWPAAVTFPLWYCLLMPVALGGLLFALLERLHRTRILSK